MHTTWCSSAIARCNKHIFCFDHRRRPSQVAHVLLNDILQKLVSRAGNESRQPVRVSCRWDPAGPRHLKGTQTDTSCGRLFPLNYDRLLRADEGNAMPLQVRCRSNSWQLREQRGPACCQVFPDVHSSFRAAVIGFGHSYPGREDDLQPAARGMQLAGNMVKCLCGPRVVVVW